MNPPPKRFRRALLAVNPRARRGTTPRDAIAGTLRRGGIDLIDVEPGPGRSIGEIIAEYASQCDCVVIGGGDGSLNAAAPALVATGLPLGVLPLGTANDFARTLGLPLDPIRAAEFIVGAKPRGIDLGEVNGHLFFNVASIGFSAELARDLTASAKRRWGTLGYGIATARLLSRSRLFSAEFDHDGITETIRTLQISVGNGRHYGGGMTVEATATADDGKLDFYSLEVDHWWRLLRLLPSLRRGTQSQWGDVRAFRTTEVTIRTRRPRPVNTDGELTTSTPAHFRIRPKAIQVFAPPPLNPAIPKAVETLTPSASRP